MTEENTPIAYLYAQGHKRSKHSIIHWVANPPHPPRWVYLRGSISCDSSRGVCWFFPITFGVSGGLMLDRMMARNGFRRLKLYSIGSRLEGHAKIRRKYMNWGLFTIFREFICSSFGTVWNFSCFILLRRRLSWAFRKLSYL